MVERSRYTNRGGDTGSSRDTGRDIGRGRDEPRSERGGRDAGRGDPPARGGRDSGRDTGRESPSRGSGSSKTWTFQGRTKASADKRATQGANDFDKYIRDDVRMFSPKAGRNRIRILPGTWIEENGEPAEHYGYDIFVHYGVGPDRATYLDLFKMKGEPDPVSEELAALKRDPQATEDEVKELESKKRVGVLLVDRDNESEGVQFWAMPWGIDRDITLVSYDEGGGVITIEDPDHGYDVEFTKSGQNIQTKYSGVAVARRESRLGKDEWLDFAIDNPIPTLLKYYTYDEINKVFSGGGQQSERDRGGDAPRSREESPSRGSDRGGRDQARDEAPAERGRDTGRGRSREPEPARLSWGDIHGMTSGELDALVAEMPELDKINPNDASTDAELADWICEDLGIKDEPADPPPSRSRETAPADKLEEMRSRRGR